MRKEYRIYGEEGLLNERREKLNLGGQLKKDDSVKRCLARAKARIKYLTEVLKIMVSERYQAINIVFWKQSSGRFVTDLCTLA